MLPSTPESGPQAPPPRAIEALPASAFGDFAETTRALSSSEADAILDAAGERGLVMHAAPTADATPLPKPMPPPQNGIASGSWTVPGVPRGDGSQPKLDAKSASATGVAEPVRIREVTGTFSTFGGAPAPKFAESYVERCQRLQASRL